MPCIASSITATNTSLFQSDIRRFTSFYQSSVCFINVMLFEDFSARRMLGVGCRTTLAVGPRLLGPDTSNSRHELVETSESDGADLFGSAPYSHPRVTLSGCRSLLSAIEQLRKKKKTHSTKKSLLNG
jgi:hypothetical protein